MRQPQTQIEALEILSGYIEIFRERAGGSKWNIKWDDYPLLWGIRNRMNIRVNNGKIVDDEKATEDLKTILNIFDQGRTINLWTLEEGTEIRLCQQMFTQPPLSEESQESQNETAETPQSVKDAVEAIENVKVKELPEVDNGAGVGKSVSQDKLVNLDEVD